jgi:hypothetical protein
VAAARRKSIPFGSNSIYSSNCNEVAAVDFQVAAFPVVDSPAAETKAAGDGKPSPILA